jgi:hypothetical protein
VAEVAENKTTSIRYGAVCRRAKVSRWVPGRKKRNTDQLIIEAARSLVETSLGKLELDPPSVQNVIAVSRDFIAHFGRNRAFYSVVFQSSLAPTLNKMINAAIAPHNPVILELALGVSGDRARARDNVAFVTERSRRIITAWIVAPAPEESPDAIVARLGRFIEQIGAGERLRP